MHGQFEGEIKADVEKFIRSHIYENIYKSNAYDGLIGALIDIYSILYMIVYLKGHISNLSIQPDNIVDAYLDAFGFEGKELFNYIQRREIAKSIMWYLNRKGTPSLIIKFLDMLGFSYYFFTEFEICKINDDLIPDDHAYVSRLIYEEKPDYNTEGLYEEQIYTFDQIREEDPISFVTDEQLTNNENVTFPAACSYYQIGVSISYPKLEIINAAFTYAMIKKTIININNGEDIYNISIKNYDGKVSFIGAVLGFSYILNQYFGIDQEGIYPGQVFGYNKDVTDMTPLDIMQDIQLAFNQLMEKLEYRPDELTGSLININVDLDIGVNIENITVNRINTIISRKEEHSNKIYNIFYADPLFNSYEDMVNMLIQYDSDFKDYIDSLLLTEEEIMNLYATYNTYEIEKHLQTIIEFLNDILEALEYNVFDNTNIILPIKNLSNCGVKPLALAIGI